jgi:hypothetical protein
MFFTKQASKKSKEGQGYQHKLQRECTTKAAALRLTNYYHTLLNRSLAWAAAVLATTTMFCRQSIHEISEQFHLELQKLIHLILFVLYELF